MVSGLSQNAPLDPDVAENVGVYPSIGRLVSSVEEEDEDSGYMAMLEKAQEEVPETSPRESATRPNESEGRDDGIETSFADMLSQGYNFMGVIPTTDEQREEAGVAKKIGISLQKNNDGEPSFYKMVASEQKELELGAQLVGASQRQSRIDKTEEELEMTSVEVVAFGNQLPMVAGSNDEDLPEVNVRPEENTRVDKTEEGELIMPGVEIDAYGKQLPMSAGSNDENLPEVNVRQEEDRIEVHKKFDRDGELPTTKGRVYNGDRPLNGNVAAVVQDSKSQKGSTNVETVLSNTHEVKYPSANNERDKLPGTLSKQQSSANLTATIQRTRSQRERESLNATVSGTDNAAATSKVPETSGTTFGSGVDLLPYLDNLCSGPYDLLQRAGVSKSTTQKRTAGATGDKKDGDDTSVGSVSTIGVIFSDLASLPSLASLGLQNPFLDNGNEDDDNDTILSVGDLSIMSEGRKAGAPLNCDSQETEGTTIKASSDNAGSVNTRLSLDSTNVEKAIEKKLDALNLESELSDTANKVKGASDPTKSPTKVKTNASEESNISRRNVLLEDLTNAIENYGQYDIRCANITSALADVYYENGEYEDALKLYNEASAVYSAKLGDVHVTTLDSRIHIGESLQKLGRYDEAIRTHYGVMQIRKGLHGDTDSTVADALVMISKSLRHKPGRVQQALKELKRSLKMYRTSVGDSHPKVSAVIDDIASLYMLSGNSEKAAAILDEVVKLKAATSGMYNKDVAATLISLGNAQQALGDTEAALKSYKKSYTICVSTSGEYSEQATVALERIAINHRLKGNDKQAIRTFTGVIQGKKQSMGNTHPQVAATYLDLALCLRDTGELDKATKCLKHALTICISEGKDIQEVGMIADIMHELGVIHQLKGRPKDAIKVITQELIIRRKMGSRELSRVARALFYLGSAQQDVGLYPKALLSLTEALEIYKKLDESSGLDFAETLLSAGLVFQATKHDDRARQAFLETLKIFYSHKLGEEHELVVMANSKLKELGYQCECECNCWQNPCESKHGRVSI